LTTSYWDKTGNHIPYREHAKFHGTDKYASIGNHLKIEACRRDDLESLGYTLVYFLKGELPWQHVQVDRKYRRRVMGQVKMNISLQSLTTGLPEEIEQYFNYLETLTFDSEPDYVYLVRLFHNLMEKHGIPFDNLYDWTIIADQNPNSSDHLGDVKQPVTYDDKDHLILQKTTEAEPTQKKTPDHD